MIAIEGMAGVVEQLDVNGFDLSCQSRVAIDGAAVADYAAVLSEGGELPAAEAFRDGDGTLYLSSGFHRRLAYQRAGCRTMPTVVRLGGRWSALENGMRANAQHGVRLTREDRRHNVEMALRERPGMSDRAVADLTGVSHTFVGKVRATVNSCQSAVRVGRDGRPISTAKIGEWRREGGSTVNGLQSTSVPVPSEGAKETTAEGEKPELTITNCGSGACATVHNGQSAVVHVSVPKDGPVSVSVERDELADIPAELREWVGKLTPVEVAALRRFIRLRRSNREPEGGLGWRAVVDARRALGGFSVQPFERKAAEGISTGAAKPSSEAPAVASGAAVVEDESEVASGPEGRQDEAPGVEDGALPDRAKGRELTKRAFEFIGRAKKAAGDLNTIFASRLYGDCRCALDAAGKALERWQREELEDGGF